jgi:hypothetical protein
MDERGSAVRWSSVMEHYYSDSKTAPPTFVNALPRTSFTFSALNWDGYNPEALIDERKSSTRWSRGISSRGIPLFPKWRHLLPNVLLLLVACAWLSLTVWLSSVSSSDHPPTIFSRPEWTVLVLSFLSNGTVFLMGELTVGTCELLRWVLISRPTGVGMATFLGLSRATSFVGVMSLFFSDQQTNHRRWCSQRYVSYQPH